MAVWDGGSVHGSAAAAIGWFRLSVEDPGLRRVLFESYGVFTPLQLVLAVVKD
jgi:hypothetical protein